MKDALLKLAELTVILFYAGAIFAICQGLYQSYQKHIFIKRLMRDKREIEQHIASMTPEEHGVFADQAEEAFMNEGRVKGENIDGIHDPKIMGRIGKKPVPRKEDC